MEEQLNSYEGRMNAQKKQHATQDNIIQNLKTEVSQLRAQKRAIEDTY